MARKQNKNPQINRPLPGGVIQSTRIKEHGGDGRWANPNNNLPQLLPGPSQEPTAHQRPVSANAGEHRGTTRAGAPVKDSQGCPGWAPPRTVAGGLSSCPDVEPLNEGQWEGSHNHPADLGRLLPGSAGRVTGCRGKTCWDCTRFLGVLRRGPKW